MAPVRATGTIACRFCGHQDGELVLDMGRQPACDHFPLVDDRGTDPVHPVRLWLCDRCHLAQLAEDPTVPDEPRAVEPQALLDQAVEAVEAVSRAGFLPAGGRVVEYGSPHGGSWLDLLATRGLTVVPDAGRADAGRADVGRADPVDVVLDCFGLMHDADQAGALAERAARLAPGGTLLVQYHSLGAVLRRGQWNQFRHGHPVYLSTPALVGMLREVGLTAVSAWWFPLYGGTVLLAARHDGEPDASLDRVLAGERALGVTDPAALGTLQQSSAETADALREWLRAARAQGRRVLGYGAASRAVPLLNRTAVGPGLLEAVADASEAKQGRRIPGVGIPIVAPSALTGQGRVDVLVLVPDLLEEVRRRYPGVEATGGRWVVAEPAPHVVDARDVDPGEVEAQRPAPAR